MLVWYCPLKKSATVPEEEVQLLQMDFMEEVTSLEESSDWTEQEIPSTTRTIPD